MKSQPSLRPHDVVVLIAIALDPRVSYRALAAAAGVSVGGAHAAVDRLALSRLIRKPPLAVNVKAVLDFLLYGVPYAFPGQIGRRSRGVPTAHSAPPMSDVIEGGTPIVWPSRDGDVLGDSLTPLSPSAPRLAEANGDLYRCLAAVDALRVGAARERRLAREFLEAQLSRSAKAASLLDDPNR